MELVPAQLSTQAQPRPGLQLVGEPRLVEPDCRDLAALVAHGGLQNGQPTSCRADRDAPHLAGDHRLLLAEQVRDRRLPHRLLVVARPVLEQVADRPQAELGQLAAL
jgi:hypothetical protein